MIKSVTLSDNGWDSIMMEHCTGYFLNGTRYLICNDNGFGEQVPVMQPLRKIKVQLIAFTHGRSSGNWHRGA